MIAKNDSSQRLDRFIAKTVPSLPSSLAQKYIRTKRIKVNGKGAKRDYRLLQDDIVQMYVNDEFFEDASGNEAYLNVLDPSLDIVYEDENIMLVNKPSGVLCHSEDGFGHATIIARIQAYLYRNGQWRPRDENSFTPALCNRIDRNTSGIVVAAKNAETLRIINEKLRLHEIDKYYLAVVHGIPNPQSAVLEGYIFKDAVNNRVYVSSTNKPGAKPAAMEYRTLKSAKHPAGFLSLLECRLITGRTHQIRAQLASIGHPILGDGKYGRGDLNAKYGEEKQSLCSYKVVFSFKTEAKSLSYLKDKTFELSSVPFADKYF